MKKILAVILTCTLLFLSPFGNNYVKAEENEPPVKISSKSYILMEADTGQVILENNADEKLRPASVTKIMTLLLIFEQLDAGIISYDDVVTISAHAASMGGSQCFFEEGEQQSVADLIKCIEVASGNDAAVAMGEYIGGSEEAFVGMMNEKAKALGMENTNFENACGLENPEHLTSARDIAIMSRELITKHPDIYKYSTIWMDSIVHTTKRGSSQFDLANTNKLLKKYPYATGLKTGYTSQAKYCMSATASKDGVNLIAVIMGAETKEIRNDEAVALLEYGFSRCKLYEDKNVLDEDLKIRVNNATQKYVSYDIIEQCKIMLIDTTADNIKKKIVIYDNLIAPVYKGDIIGTVQYMIDDKVIKEVSIVAAEDVTAKTYGSTVQSFFLKLLRKQTERGNF